jgi:hypothetical protein
MAVAAVPFLVTVIVVSAANAAVGNPTIAIASAAANMLFTLDI